MLAINKREAFVAITLRDVAKRAGVSAMTVSRVINGSAGVDADTQRRVEGAILELEYVPNRVARGLVSQKTRTIGLIVPDVVNPFFAPVVRGAETTARKAGYRVLLCNSEANLRLEREYIADLVEHRVEGLLLAPASDRSRVALLPLLRGEFPDRAPRSHAAGHRLRLGRQRQRRRRQTADRAPDPRRPSPYRAFHRFRRRVDRARPSARLPDGARSGWHRISPRISFSGPPSTASAAIAPCSRCLPSIRFLRRSSL